MIIQKLDTVSYWIRFCFNWLSW